MAFRCYIKISGYSIDSNKSLLSVLAQGSYKQILVSLGIEYVEGEYSETWRNTCSSCSTVYWDILRQLFSVMANCLISNKIKNYNSQLAARGDSRKANKFYHHYNLLVITVDNGYSDNGGDMGFLAILSLYPIYHYIP